MQFDASHGASDVIKAAVLGDEFQSVDHRTHIKSKRNELRMVKENRAEAIFNQVIENSTPAEQKRMSRNFKGANSSWLTCKISMRDNFYLSKNEFHDALSLRYGLPIRQLPSKCDGCNDEFTVQHALSCKKGGLVTQRHNEVRDILGELAGLAWNNVQREPLIREGCEGSTALKADLLIRGFWTPQENASFDIRVTDTDANSYSAKSSEQVLAMCEAEKKQKYQTACSERHISFTPLVVSVDGVLAKEFQMFTKRLADRLAGKFGKPYSTIITWLRTRISFAGSSRDKFVHTWN